MLLNPNFSYSNDGIEWLSPEEAHKRGLLKVDKGFIYDGTSIVYHRPPHTLWEHLVAWWEER